MFLSDGAFEQIEKLVSELRAITYWDIEYQQHRCHEEYEHLAFVSRQRRRSEIIRQLLRISRWGTRKEAETLPAVGNGLTQTLPAAHLERADERTSRPLPCGARGYVSNQGAQEPLEILFPFPSESRFWIPMGVGRFVSKGERNPWDVNKPGKKTERKSGVIYGMSWKPN